MKLVECKDDVYGQYDIILKKDKSYELVSIGIHYFKVKCEFCEIRLTQRNFIEYFYTEKETRKRKLEKLNFLFEQ